MWKMFNSGFVLLSLCALASSASAAFTPISTSECSKTKSCFYNPDPCTGEDCAYFSSWKPVNASNMQYLEIELSGPVKSSSGYMAMGFSLDNKMGDDGVVGCIASGTGAVTFRAAYNAGHSNTFASSPAGFLVTSGFGDLLGGAFKSSGNRLSCRFRRLLKPASNVAELKDLSSPNKYFVLLSRSASTDNSGFHIHFAGGNQVSGTSFALASDSFGSGRAAKFTLVKAHAGLMMVAWLMLSSIGIIMARGMKTVWVAKSLCGERVWFQIHRSVQVCCVLCTVAGFVIIFVHVGGYTLVETLPAKAHPILGIIVTALAVANPIIALFRPHPNTPKRPIFNWVHFTVGSLAQIFALANIFIGVKMPPAGPRFAAADYPLWILIGYTVFCILMEIGFFINGRRLAKASAKVTHSGNESAVKSASSVQKILLGIYILVVSSVAIALVILMALD